MKLSKIIENLVFFISIAIESKKIFILWLLFYIVGLSLIYTYKLNYYQYDLEIRIFKQYTPMERIFPRGDDPLAFDLIKKELFKYDVSWRHDPEGKFIEITSTIVENNKGKIEKIIEDIKTKINKYKQEVVKITINTNKALDDEVKKLIVDDVQERSNFYKYYFTQKYLNKLFVNEYSETFIQDNYKYENIIKVQISLIVKLFSFYVVIFYLLNLLVLIFVKEYKKKDI